ncbi:MAG: ATP-dependent DNA helicase [Pseudomonadota bacterium]
MASAVITPGPETGLLLDTSSEDAAPDGAPQDPVWPAWMLMHTRGRALCVSQDGEVEDLTGPELAAFLSEHRVLLCHTAFTGRRIGLPGPLDPLRHYDVMELFAFCEPAAFCTPSAPALSRYLDLEVPHSPDEAALALDGIARALLARLVHRPEADRAQAWRLARVLVRARWPWAAVVLSRLTDPAQRNSGGTGFEVWSGLTDFEDVASPPPAGVEPIDGAEAEAELTATLAQFGDGLEEREGQREYAKTLARAFTPAAEPGHPNLVIAEAATGTGKTLGYLAPARAWMGKNGRGVWLSTHTKALQRQLVAELDRVFVDGGDKAAKVAVRKGRENYVCLLNFQEAVAQQSLDPVGLALVARWLRHTKDGDMIGGDFPGWLMPRLATPWGGNRADGVGARLTDRRGECVYSACNHYRKCFVEKSLRRAERADLVIANHAVLLVEAQRRGQAAPPSAEDPSEDEAAESSWPLRHIVFDESHHLLNAADSAFSLALTVRECADLRRWIRGLEDPRSRGRSRGLFERAGDLVDGDEASEAALKAVVRSAAALPHRLPASPEAEALQTAGDRFFAAALEQVTARTERPGATAYGQEALVHPPSGDLAGTAVDFASDLIALAKALRALAHAFEKRLVEGQSEDDRETRIRLEAMQRGLARRAEDMLPGWIGLLLAIEGSGQGDDMGDEAVIDRLVVDRLGGQCTDVGLTRHWRDPMQAFAQTVLDKTQGAVFTSATLYPPGVEEAAAQATANQLCGVVHLDAPPTHLKITSPFDFERQAQVLVVTDVDKQDLDQVAGAYRGLCLAAGGGTLGLLTAIRRIREVHRRIARDLEEAGLPVYAQHVDAVDTGTLIDLFREDEDACLFGTDSLREGIDVPGRSLRLVMLDRVPWAQPSLIHKARREVLGGKAYDDYVARLRLAQAFGRLIRSRDDKGVFVILDRRTPSRLLAALPPTCPVHRVGIAEALSRVREAVGPNAAS